MKSIEVVICDECKQALFVNGHPRNFCGHSNRGTLTEFVPRSEVAPFVGDATHPDWVPYVASNLLAALQTVPDTGDWHAAVRSWCEQHIDGPPDDDTYGQYNADGTPKRALRRTLEGMRGDDA